MGGRAEQGIVRWARATISCAAVIVLVGCGADSESAKSAGSSTAATPPPTGPQVGQTLYVMDHAYTDDVYAMIRDSGTDTWPAQTDDSKPDKSYHLVRPYPCKITDVRDDGFVKCTVDSDNTLDVKTVWTNRPMTKDQAEAAAPGTVIHTTAPVAAGTPSWLRIKVGTALFTGYDGGDSETASICPTRAAFMNDSSGGDSKCSHYKPGLKIHIVAYSNDYSLDGKTNFPVLQVAADNGSWSGFTGSLLQVQPRVPVGTRLMSESGSNSKTRIWAGKHDPYFSGFELPDRATIEVLKQDPSDVQNCTLYVKVLAGRYSGKVGWTLDMGLETLNGTPLMLTL